jgi:hypothetical protein
MRRKTGMASIDEQILRAAKEIVVKFIEAGRVSPAGFPETFQTVYRTIDQTVREDPQADTTAPAE